MAFVPGIQAANVEPQQAPTTAAGEAAEREMFHALLDQAAARYAGEEPPSVQSASIQKLNVLGGQYPPPEMGVGYLQIYIELAGSMKS
jgi:hypothetical protein